MRRNTQPIIRILSVQLKSKPARVRPGPALDREWRRKRLKSLDSDSKMVGPRALPTPKIWNPLAYASRSAPATFPASPHLAGSGLSRADPPLERLIERVAGGEGLFERGDADPLGAFGQKPAGLFEWLLERFPDPPRPAKQGRKAAKVESVA